MNKEQLLKLIGSLIRASDSGLVDKKSCFPCPKDQHEHYRAIRDCIQKMYDEADFTQSSLFIKETEGKSKKFIDMKAKFYRDPVKLCSHRNSILEKLCDLETIWDAKNYINIQHQQLFIEVLDRLGKCHDA